jgi:hypothetical protein
MLCTVLGRRDLRSRYVAREAGACLPHVAGIIAEGDAEVARMLAEKLRRDLGLSEAFELVAGRDTDARLRVALRAALPSALATDAPQVLRPNEPRGSSRRVRSASREGGRSAGTWTGVAMRSAPTPSTCSRTPVCCAPRTCTTCRRPTSRRVVAPQRSFASGGCRSSPGPWSAGRQRRTQRGGYGAGVRARRCHHG